MSLTPTFQEPTDQPSQDDQAAIIQIDAALRSMRDSGFDLTAAAGEPIDNSIEAGANRIQVLTKYGPNNKSIEEIAFADNGRGINPNILAKALSVGFSTRYGERGGLGRFGMGLKLAGLSLGERLEVYTKQAGDPTVRHAYVDLEKVGNKEQTYIEAHEVEGWPAEYADVMCERDGTPVASGTLVLFGKIDRLTGGGRYGTSLKDKLDELRTFIARAYRSFLDKGLIIELNRKPITLLDPLFLMDNPRITDQYSPEDPRGHEIDRGILKVGDHEIQVTVTIVPEIFRWKEGDGGSVDRYGRNINEYQINRESAGRISMVRNGREINYDIVPRLLPSGIDKIDRYIGIEVTFPAELDEYFEVRNVKRGAVPIDKLRQELRSWLSRPINSARRQIRGHWNKVEAQQAATRQEHDRAAEAAANVDKTAPQGQAGKQLTPQQSEEIVKEFLEDLGITDDTEKAEQVRKQIDSRPFTIADVGFPGKELLDIDHLNGKAIIKVNRRHPFVRDIYKPLKQIGDGETNGLTPEDFISIARKTADAIDALFLAYAKAENMDTDPERFSQLRSYWGQFTQSFINELLKEER
ncbi:ATP-binding protein [Nonomuraea sp. NPDC001831]|uniref:ATP-binding protein n=1 Tax=Nonomuraea sp. NPDC001831 TaxID=3364340 RepID=UPI003693546F